MFFNWMKVKKEDPLEIDNKVTITKQIVTKLNKNLLNLKDVYLSNADVIVSGDGKRVVVFSKYIDRYMFIFVKTSTTWVLEYELHFNGSIKHFNHDITADINDDGSVIIISPVITENNNLISSFNNTVFIFRRYNNDWKQEYLFKPENPDELIFKNVSVSISGDGLRAVVNWHDPDIIDISRNNYVSLMYILFYDKIEKNWIVEFEKTNPVLNRYNAYKHKALISKDGNMVALIKDRYNDDRAQIERVVNIFRRCSPYKWINNGIIECNDVDFSENFGWDISLSGDGAILVISAFSLGNNRIFNSRLKNVYIYALHNNVYILTKTISSGKDWSLGYVVKISTLGDILLIKSFLEQKNGLFNKGKIEIYKRYHNEWELDSVIEEDNMIPYRYMNTFLKSLSISNDASVITYGVSHITDTSKSGILILEDDGSRDITIS